MSSSGSTGLGGGGGSGVAGAIGTAASIASLAKTAYSVGSTIAEFLPLIFLARGGRVGKAGGGALGPVKIDTKDPKYRAMKVAFDKLLVRYDHNPLLAAAALEAGVSVVDNAIRKAHQVDGEITDFLPRKTQEYLFALSQAALGAHSVEAGRMGRKAGGRTGYALPGEVDDTPTATGLLPSNAMTLGDVGGDLPAPEPVTQVAELKNPDILRALRANENVDEIPTLKNPKPGSTAGGLYQYIDSTWQTQAPLAGVDIKQYPTARSAPAEVQHQVADANVSRILEQNKGDIKAVPHMWYSGNPEGKLTAEQLAANNGLTQEQYNQKFFNKFGTGEPSTTKSTGLGAAAPAAKSDQGPWEKTFSSLTKDTVPTDSSFWVPLIAGLGSMLASNQYRFSQRLGEGLIGGAAAYGKQQEFGQKEQQLAQQAAQNAALMGLKKQELGFTEREVALKEAEQKRKIDAAKAAASALTGNVPPPVVPTAKPNAGASAPSTTIGGTGTPAPVVERQTPAVGGTSTQAAAETAPEAPIPAPNSSFWANVHPQSNPHNLDEMANRFDQAAAAAAEDPSSMAAYRTSAQQYRAQANAIRQSGIVTMKDQSTASMPGFNEAKAAQAAALEKAKLDVTTSPEARAAEVEKQRLLEEEKQRYAPFEDSEGNQWRRAAPSDTPVQMAATPNTTAAAGEPVKASLDPKTARVNNVIPTPPAGGGIPQPTPPREGLVLAKSAGLSPAAKANDQKFAEEFPGKLHNAIEGEEAMQTVAQAFKLFNSNVLTEKLQGYALLARATGMPDSVVEAVAGGDPAAMQRVDKEAVPSVIGILKEGASRFGQQEFMVTQKTAVASKTAEPKANHALVGELLGKAQWNRQFLTDWDKAKDEGWRSPSAFFASWSQSNPLNTYILSATKQIGNFRGMDLPKDPNAYVEGAIYVAPERFGTPALEKYFGSIGVKPGQLFRYNGPDNLQPIAKEDHYTAHLTRRQ